MCFHQTIVPLTTQEVIYTVRGDAAIWNINRLPQFNPFHEAEFKLITVYFFLRYARTTEPYVFVLICGLNINYHLHKYLLDCQKNI